MLFHPGIIALLLGGAFTTALLLYASFSGIQILMKWDISSGSELQLRLERKTYLISTFMNYAFAFQFLSLFLFVFTVDGMSSLFIGAMCAAGSLNVNSFGYPTVILKVVNSILAGVWLIVNFTDTRAGDYPLIRMKYAFLLLIAPFVVVELILQSTYFLLLKPDVITSCCGVLFSSESLGVTSGIVKLPIRPVQWFYYGSVAATCLSGLYFHSSGRFALLFSLWSVLAFLASMTALISFISLYIYELPTHHCPFCLLKAEYRRIGYPLYVGFLGGIVFGLGCGALDRYKAIPSLREIVPQIQRKLVILSLGFSLASLLLVIYSILSSNLSMSGS